MTSLIRQRYVHECKHTHEHARTCTHKHTGDLVEVSGNADLAVPVYKILLWGHFKILFFNACKNWVAFLDECNTMFGVLPGIQPCVISYHLGRFNAWQGFVFLRAYMGKRGVAEKKKALKRKKENIHSMYHKNKEECDR